MKMILIPFFLILFHACHDNHSYKKIEPSLIKIQGDGVKVVHLEPLTVERLGIKTQVVSGINKTELIQSSALIYDTKGSIWVYVQNSLNYHRVEVKLHRIQNDLASVSFMNPDLYSVVTSGAAELYGTEAGVGK